MMSINLQSADEIHLKALKEHYESISGKRLSPTAVVRLLMKDKLESINKVQIALDYLNKK
jgi:hypothetical protein